VTRHFILGTAGHIDHGKTSLVTALTGTNTDRLPEEQRRGMTIELGFAELIVGDTRFGVVDVPGHERFVRTMVAGATGIDIALLVVAADDSVMPQTVEHVEILHLLGIRECVVAITKIDMVDTGMVELVAEEVRQLLAGTPLGGAAICPVSSVTGAGITELKQAVHAVSKRIERTAPRTPFRMAVDRVFTVQGRGTVVTGSVLRGQVSAGDTLEVWPSGET
jgi:selenocysteine-specific elongation factor